MVDEIGLPIQMICWYLWFCVNFLMISLNINFKKRTSQSKEGNLNTNWTVQVYHMPGNFLQISCEFSYKMLICIALVTRKHTSQHNIHFWSPSSHGGRKQDESALLGISFNSCAIIFPSFSIWPREIHPLRKGWNVRVVSITTAQAVNFFEGEHMFGLVNCLDFLLISRIFFRNLSKFHFVLGWYKYF